MVLLVHECKHDECKYKRVAVQVLHDLHPILIRCPSQCNKIKDMLVHRISDTTVRDTLEVWYDLPHLHRGNQVEVILRIIAREVVGVVG